MFPTLSHLVHYLTGADVRIPVQTFGVFLALSFWAAYVAFRLEFMREEHDGVVHAFSRYPLTIRQQWVLLAIYAFTGFLLGYKLVYVFHNYSLFLGAPSRFLFSPEGSLAGGLVSAILLIAWRLLLTRLNGQQTERLIYPHQQVDRLMFWCGVTGFIGALLFAKLEYAADLFRSPGTWLRTYHGLTFYGGFIFGAITYLYITTRRMGIRLIDAMDIGSPGMMLAYGVGRMGCHLSGDGDWGIVNTLARPTWIPQWAWATDYPHNVERQGMPIPDCYEFYCNVLPQPVFPTSLYESVICIGLFVLLWKMRPRLKRGGLLFFLFILFNGVERFGIEFIKLNPKHCLGGICLTQAQWIAAGFILTGVAGLYVKTRPS